MAVVTVGLFGGVYTKGKRDERERLERQQLERDAKARETRQNVDNEIAGLDPDVKRDRLDKWMRD